MDLYVVYHNPLDFPGKYVIRRQTAGRGVITIAAEPLAIGLGINQVRAALPAGLVRLERAPEDDPCIVEVWI
ncbi:MAG: hypothetical protein ACYC35_00375 [Pirellulales bacterium]